MTTHLAELEKKARELSREERAELALILIESLDITEDQAAVDESWRVEIERRVAKYERGEAKVIPGEDVFAEARRITR
jgi:putative addiction module component (TIGR02574 family)